MLFNRKKVILLSKLNNKLNFWADKDISLAVQLDPNLISFTCFYNPLRFHVNEHGNIDKIEGNILSQEFNSFNKYLYSLATKKFIIVNDVKKLKDDIYLKDKVFFKKENFVTEGIVHDYLFYNRYLKIFVILYNNNELLFLKSSEVFLTKEECIKSNKLEVIENAL